MHWEILYSNVGALDNPQAKIIGVSYNYTQQDVRYQVGQYNTCIIYSVRNKNWGQILWKFEVEI